MLTLLKKCDNINCVNRMSANIDLGTMVQMFLPHTKDATIGSF